MNDDILFVSEMLNLLRDLNLKKQPSEGDDKYAQERYSPEQIRAIHKVKIGEEYSSLINNKVKDVEEYYTYLFELMKSLQDEIKDESIYTYVDREFGWRGIRYYMLGGDEKLSIENFMKKTPTGAPGLKSFRKLALVYHFDPGSFIKYGTKLYHDKGFPKDIDIYGILPFLMKDYGYTGDQVNDFLYDKNYDCLF